MLNQVGEDVPVQAKRGSGVEGSVCEARTEVQGIGRVEIEIGGDNHVELLIEAGFGLRKDVACVYVDFDSRVQLLDLRGRSCGALFVVSISVTA